ncbi:MAG: recombinase family protein [Symbiobacteriaceae bacterium]|nr:recombinase family protein [Symbiobacteriaceae bacterium]
MLYGYAKSYKDLPSVDVLMQSFLDIGIPPDCVFVDKVISSKKIRAEYDLLRFRLVRGDVVYLCALDDLGSDLLQVSNTWKDIVNTLGADIVILGYEGILDSRVIKTDDGITSDALFHSLLRYLGSLNRQRVSNRQKKAFEAAKSKGVRLGRPRREITSEQRQIVEAWKRDEMQVSEAIRLTGIPKRTFYWLFRKSKPDRFTTIQSPDIIEEDPE